jgi:serine phosphatase RsbU (regulator of sigma subunit)/PAS domain-containing protein
MELDLGSAFGSEDERADVPNDSSTSQALNYLLPLRPADILERITDGYVVLDNSWRIMYANLRACEINQKPLHLFLGKTQWEEWPASVGSNIEREYRRAMDEMVDVHFVHNYGGDGDDLWLDIDAYPSEHRLDIFFRDVTERKKTLDALKRSREDLQIAVDAARIGTFHCEWPLDKVVWNETCKTHFFLPADAEVDIDLFYSLLHPDDLEPTRRATERALADHVTYDVDYRTVAPDGRIRWINAVGRFYYDENGLPTRFDGITHDISDRKAARQEIDEANQRTLRILESITDSFYILDHEWRFTLVNAEAECVLRKSREELVGRQIWEVFPMVIGTMFEKEYRRAMAEGVSIYLEEFSPSLSAWLEVRAYPSPDGLSVFFQNIDARKSAEAERERLLAESVARAEREAFLKRIAHALRSTDPDTVQSSVVRLLGIELKADRCYFAHYDLNHGSVTIACDFHRADLPDVVGTYSFKNTVEMYHELYRDSNVSTVADALSSHLSEQTKANMRQLNLRSRISVALADSEGLFATLTAAMSDEPRQWTDDEINLVEAVANQLRSGIAMARVAHREHNIAVQLQSALLPALPDDVPGFAISSYYRPAFAQSEGVGGDFYDVFALDQARTVLVVGDMSGKGLAAAAQVSTVRNMLRAFLYSHLDIDSAVAELNRVISRNELISGFATLMVGVFDTASGTFQYVICGQEPVLIRRLQSGAIEFLEATSPIVGGFEDAIYTSSQISLAAGDIVAIFTDGLTEVGSSRKNLLGVEGVARLLAKEIVDAPSISPHDTASKTAELLIEGVDHFAQLGSRDDMCLLVAVVI